jgi:lipoprotein-releasing system ATP-binding protein
MNKHLLHAVNLNKSYQMGRVQLQVLRDCSLSIDPGEFVCIMGKSGSGKSTLLHLLGALDIPEKGQVYFDGREVFAPQGHRQTRSYMPDILMPAERRRVLLRRREFGFVFQSYHLLPELNVLENVLIGRMVGSPVLRWFGQRRQAMDDTRRVLEHVGLSERLRHRPQELSGGERQRVAVARALVHRPRVLFADEPTGNLDTSSGGELMSLLSALNHEGQAIVLVTHDPTVAQWAHRTLHLEDGRLSGPTG